MLWEFTVDLFGRLRQQLLEVVDEALRIGRKTDPVAIILEHRLTFLPRHQLLAKVGKVTRSFDADVAAAQIAGEMGKHAHLQVAPIRRLAQGMRAAHQLSPALGRERQVHLVGEPFGPAVLVLQHHVQRLEQSAVFGRRDEAQSLRHLEHRRTP
ncbi:hypothetical protein D3C72_1803670 [compost metagenome]